MISIKNILGKIADAFYPRICPGCGELSDRPERYLCWSCFSSIPLFTGDLCDQCGSMITAHVSHRFICSACRVDRPAFDRVRAAAHFTGGIRKQIHAFKYQNALWLKRDFADLLEGCLMAHFDIDAIDAVLPVPLHPVRQRERTYNQSAILAGELARRLDRRLDTRSLIRIKQTGTQTRLHARERHKNMAHAFQVVRPEWVRGRTLLVVDDVMTTGATLDACAKELKKAGARRVWGIALARGV